jgi:PAS domain S-box-containing protein
VAQERILIVEDEGIVAADLESTIQHLGYRVAGTATTGPEAIAKAERLTPDLVLMDIRLKGPMDGIEAAEQIIAQLDIPVAYLTAYADEDTLGRAKMTLPYGYILKPFEEKDVRTAIELALYKHRMERMMATLEGWHAAALRSMPEAVLAVDTTERITFMNEQAEILFGWPLQEIYGKPLQDFLSQTISLAEIIKRPRPARSEGTVPFLTKNGHTVESLYSASPLRDKSGHETGVVYIFYLSRQATALSPSKAP